MKVDDIMKKAKQLVDDIIRAHATQRIVNPPLGPGELEKCVEYGKYAVVDFFDLPDVFRVSVTIARHEGQFIVASIVEARPSDEELGIKASS